MHQRGNTELPCGAPPGFLITLRDVPSGLAFIESQRQYTTRYTSQCGLSSVQSKRSGRSAAILTTAAESVAGGRRTSRTKAGTGFLLHTREQTPERHPIRCGPLLLLAERGKCDG